MTTINTDLLRRTLAEIEDHPKQWEQERWGACFAAHAALLAGGELLPAKVEGYCDELFRPEPDDPPENIRPHGGVHVSVRAQRILGLTYRQSLNLFCWTSTLDDLRTCVAGLIAGAATRSADMDDQ